MNTPFFEQFDALDDARAPEVARRIEAGEGAAAITEVMDLSPVGMVAALARVALWPAGLAEMDGPAAPALVRSEPTRPRLAEAVADEAFLAALFPHAGRPARLALAAGLLQALDAWEASHTAAQVADDLGESATAAAWHMIAHRREPDMGNAHYWARRVAPLVESDGPIQLAKMAGMGLARLEATAAERRAAGRLVDGSGAWNPAAMIDLCGLVRPGSPAARFARGLQRVEMFVLLDRSVAEVAG